MTLVVILTVRQIALDAFRAFERHAAGVMKRHGGAIERAVVIGLSEPAELFKEIHVVTFPDEASFASYRSDPELRAVAHLREASVVSTEILVGVDGPDYGALSR